MRWPRVFVFVDVVLVVVYAVCIFVSRSSRVAMFEPRAFGLLCIWILFLMSPPLIVHRVALMRGERSPFKGHAGAMGFYLLLAFLLAQKTAAPVSVLLSLSDQVRSVADVEAPYGQPFVEEDEMVRELVSPRYYMRLKDGERLSICEPTYRAIMGGLRAVGVTEARSFGARVVISDCVL